MTFIHTTLLLGGLTFLAVPLLLLLLHRRRLVIPWAAWEWMEKALRQKKKRIRLTELLKLLSKLLLVTAVALLLGRLALTARHPGNVLLIVDTTPSMATRTGPVHSRLDRARELAGEVVRRTDAAVALCTFDGTLHPVSTFQEDRGTVLRLLNGIVVSGRSASAADLEQAILAYPELRGTANIIVVSDFQACWYGDDQPLRQSQSRLGKEKTLWLLPVDRRARVTNVGLTEFRLAPEGLYPGTPAELQVRVRNFGQEPVAKLPVTLAIGGTDQDRGLVDLQPGEDKWVVLSLNLAAAGEHELVVSVPPDAYPLDDRLTVLLAVREQARLLAVVPEAAGLGEFDLDVFFRSALAASARESWWQYRRVLPQQVFQETPGSDDVVVLFGVAVRQGDPLQGWLDEHLRAGRGVVVFSDVGQADAWSGLPLRLLPPAEAAESPPALDPERLAGSYADFLTEPGLNPLLIHFLRFAPVDAAPGEGRLFARGVTAPVVARRAVGPGVLVGAGFLPYPGFTDFLYNPNFVPFCLRLTWDALHWQPAHAVFGAESEALVVPGLNAVNRYSVSGPEGVPTAVPLSLTAGQPRLQVPPTVTGGFCTVLENDTPVYRFGHNASRQDSDVDTAADRLLRPRPEPAAAGFRVVSDAELPDLTAKRELTALLAILFVLALILENYAHLVRKS